MIHWLIESFQDLTEQPEWFLSKAEQEKFASLSFDKRRSDWLLGRWTAKRLVQAVLLEQDTHIVALDAIEIHNDASGVPFATCNLQPVSWNLSISHSHAHAFCAVSQTHIGADLEYIEPRDENLVNDYFTADEIARVNASSPETRTIIINALWSAKEAALKAVGKGLSVDTRAVEISIAPFEHAPETWTPFAITLRADESAWSPSVGQAQGTAPILCGWWRVLGEFVLTLAVERQDVPDAAELQPETVLVAHAPAPHPHTPHRIGHIAHHPTHHASDVPVKTA